jgi:hypothetical protein
MLVSADTAVTVAPPIELLAGQGRTWRNVNMRR